MTKLKLCIWFKTTSQPWGGSNQFLSALVKQLEKMGHLVTHSPQPRQTQIVLINAFLNAPGRYISVGQVAQLRQTGNITPLGKWTPIQISLLFPRRGPLLVHRLDGVAAFYRGEKTKADLFQPIINQMTDYTIFQSTYCRTSFEQVGVCPPHFQIIHNGVDPEIFYPPSTSLPKRRKLRLVASSWSQNPRKGFSVLSQLSKIPDVEVWFIGRWCPTIDPANVTLLGVKSSVELAEALRQCDALVHAGENETCSNAILESLACGLPILFRDSGANQELAGEYGIVFTTDLANDLMKLKESYHQLREKILADRLRFLISRAAKEYLQAFEQALDLNNDASPTKSKTDLVYS